MPNDAYLGDGAYVKEDEQGEFVTIFTHNGHKVTNQVVLGIYEIEHLRAWLIETGWIK